MSENGCLEVILGPMFSGKTTALIQQYNSNESNIVAINFSGDKRYHESKLSTHDLKMIECVNSNELLPLKTNNEILQASTILINEGQFFPDLVQFVSLMVDIHKKKVIVCGLDSDFQRNKFGVILDLIPLCDKVTKLKGKCNDCNNESIFSYRLSEEEEQVVIGSNNYIPLCRNCYLIRNNR